MMDLRGYALLLAAIALCVLQAQPAFLEVALLLVIVALSKDGSWLTGRLANDLNKFSALKSTFMKAVLMAMPVKTLTAMLGASSQDDFAAVTLSATSALLVLGLLLGLTATFLAHRRNKFTKTGEGKAPKWLTLFDTSLIILLLMLGDDGPAIFGAPATWLREQFPFLVAPEVRGALAIIPVKTVTTLMLAGSIERQRIASHGSAVMVVLASLTFTAFWMSSIVPVMLALAIGIFAAMSSFISLNTFKRVVREEAEGLT